MLAKSLHVAFAYATGLSFLVRGALAFTDSPLLQHRALKTIPHILDTVLLGSALFMLFQWSLSPLTTPWISVKIGAVLVYIAFGFLMLRFGTTPTRKITGLLGGILTYLYIVSVAHSKTPLPWLVLLNG